MPAELENMMYVRRSASDVPWHGLGNAVTLEQLRTMSDEEIASIGGINWHVSKRFLRIAQSQGSDVFVPATMAGGAKLIGLFRDDTTECLNVVSDRYKVVQNTDMVRFFREYTDAGEMTIETVGSLKGGAVIWALAKVNHGSDWVLPGGDLVKAHILLVNSHDGSLSYQGKTVSTRVVCMNTLSAALGESGGKLFKMRHSKKDRKQIEADAKATLNSAINAHRKMYEVADKLCHSKVDMKGEVVREYVYHLLNGQSILEKTLEQSEAMQGGDFLSAAISATEQKQAIKKAASIKDEDLGRVGKSILDAMMDSPGSNLESAKNTWWGVVNGVSYYTDHVAGRSRDTALQSAWLGNNDALKTNALKLAVQYAGRPN